MPSTITLWSTCGALVLLLPAAGQQDVRGTLQARYDRFNASLIGKNLAAFTALCTADCKFTTRPGGPTLSLDQFRQATTASFKTMVVRQATTHIDALHLDHNTAYVKATWTGDFASVSQEKKRHQVHSVQQLQDTWTRGAGRWQLQTSTVVSLKTTVDGKPVRQ